MESFRCWILIYHVRGTIGFGEMSTTKLFQVRAAMRRNGSVYCRDLLRQSITKLVVTVRTNDRILGVESTIADLAGGRDSLRKLIGKVT